MDKSAAIQWATRLLRDPQAVILDTETTDLNGYVVEIAVISMQGETLINTRLHPQMPINPHAARVHGITIESLATAPTFADIAPYLAPILEGKTICAYNASFDQKILMNELQRLQQEWSLTWTCLMKPYSAWVGEWQGSGYRWQKLPAGDHSALGDCRAALNVLHRMAGSSAA